MSLSIQEFETAMFKPVADGFIFRAPRLWPFGRARYLVANESQKSVISDRIAGSGRWRLLLTLVIWIVVYSGAVGAWASASGKSESSFADVIVMLVLAIASVILCLKVWYALSLRPVIGGLPESAERISYQERRDALRRAMSLRSWLLAGSLWTVACVINVHTLLLKSHGFRHATSMSELLPQLMFAGLSGLLAIRFLYLEFRNAKARLKEVTQGRLSLDSVVKRLERVESENARFRRSLVALVAMGGILGVGAMAVTELSPRGVEADSLRLGAGGTSSIEPYRPLAQVQKTFSLASPAEVDKLISRLQPAPPRAVVEEYLSAAGAKVWVYSAAAHSRTISTGAPTVNVAKQRALEQCAKLTKASDCTVIVVNNDFVSPLPGSSEAR